MGPSVSEALWFLPAVVPIGLFVAFSDLSRMKIPNLSVYALVASFLALGLFALPFETYAWRLLHLPVLLVVGMVLNALGMMGAGDAKFIAAAAPFVALSDSSLMMYMLACGSVAGYLIHSLARRTALTRLFPHWESWTSGRRFPMGFPLATTLICYLALPLLTG